MMNPRVREIISINDFKINALWSNEEVRVIDFASFLSEYFDRKESIYHKILNKETFCLAKTDGRTLYWDGLVDIMDYDGKMISTSLDFCPDVLFNESVLIS